MDQEQAAVEIKAPETQTEVLEEAKNAVRAALGGEEAEEGAEEAPAKAKAEEPAEPSETEIRKRLKERSRVIKERQSAKEEAERITAESRKLQAELEFHKRQIQQEYAKLHKLKSNPVEAIREAGWDPEELIHSLARSGSYEGKLEQQMAAQKRMLEEQRQRHEAYVRHQQEMQEQHMARQQEAYRGSIENKFIESALNEEKHPFTNAFYADRKAALVAEGDWIADQYREVTGREASLDDIADYIEEQLQLAYNTFSEKKKSVSSKKGKPAQSELGKKPPKILNPKDVEKSSMVDDEKLKDLDDDDLLAKAKQAARLALRSE